jgi:hypothetical protein
MKLALIPPIDMLDDTCLTHVQMMLPHLLKFPFYANAYRRLAQDSTQFVIMDNGAAESETFNMEALLFNAMSFNVDEIVCPDALGNALNTFDLTGRFIDLAIKEKWTKGLGVVAQGSTVHEAYDTAVEMIEAFKAVVTAVHIPRLLIKPGRLSARLFLAKRLHDEYPNISIHLLGASPLWCSEIKRAPVYIRSMDTSMPYVYGRARYYVDRQYGTPPPTRGNDESFFTSKWNSPQYSACQYNVETMLKWSK